MSTLDHPRIRRRMPHRRGAQRGVSLIFALITLVALMLATLALIRSVDTSALLMGNLGFKQDATSSADQATRKAIDWLTLKSASLNLDVAASGYYASTLELDADGTTVLPPVDVTGRQFASTDPRQLVDWDGDGCKYMSGGTCGVLSASAGTINGNTARYVVFRLCSKPGDYALDKTISCAKPIASSGNTAGKRGELNYTDPARFAGGSGPYYRIVVRVQGARNTASFTETIVHF
jgi:Tfp pilus assembly protein PilX